MYAQKKANQNSKQNAKSQTHQSHLLFRPRILEEFGYGLQNYGGRNQTQRPRIDLNNKFLPRPNTTTA